MVESERVTPLVQLLLDRSATIDARDDAAIDLGAADDPQAIDALLRVGSDPEENELIASSCGESLAHIASRNGEHAKQWLAALAFDAAADFRATLTALRPGLLD